MKPKIRVTTFRKPYYAVCDGIVGLQTVLGDPVTPVLARHDSKLKDLVEQLRATADALHSHLEANYLWD